MRRRAERAVDRCRRCRRAHPGRRSPRRRCSATPRRSIPQASSPRPERRTPAAAAAAAAAAARRRARAAAAAGLRAAAAAGLRAAAASRSKRRTASRSSRSSRVRTAAGAAAGIRPAASRPTRTVSRRTQQPRTASRSSRSNPYGTAAARPAAAAATVRPAAGSRSSRQPRTASSRRSSRVRPAAAAAATRTDSRRSSSRRTASRRSSRRTASRSSRRIRTASRSSNRLRPAAAAGEPYGQPQQPAAIRSRAAIRRRRIRSRRRSRICRGPLDDIARKLPQSAPGTIFGIPVARLRDPALQRRSCSSPASRWSRRSSCRSRSARSCSPWSGGGFEVLPDLADHRRWRVSAPHGGAAGPAREGPAGRAALDPVRRRVRRHLHLAHGLRHDRHAAAVAAAASGSVTHGGLYILGYAVLVFGLLARIAQPQDQIARIIIAVGGGMLDPGVHRHASRRVPASAALADPADRPRPAVVRRDRRSACSASCSWCRRRSCRPRCRRSTRSVR